MHDGRPHRVTPLHGDAGCSSASSFWATWELQSHTRGRPPNSLAPSCCGCVDQIRCSRIAHRAQHLMRGCAPTRMSEAISSPTAAHMINSDNKQLGRTMQTVETHRRSLSPRQEQETDNHWILPVLMCENWSRTTCSRFHRLHSESTLACGGGLWGNTCGTCCPTAPSPHALKRKNAIDDTDPAEPP